MGKRFSQSVKTEMADRYLAGESGTAIASSLGASPTTVFAVLRQQGVPLNGHHPNAIRTRKREIARMYLSGMSGPEIAAALSCCPALVYRYIREAGSAVRRTAETSRVYSLDASAFDRPSVGREYWLGFIMADGCLSKNGPGWSLQIGLAEKDQHHLAALASFLGYDGPIRTTDNSRGYGVGRLARLAITRTDLATKLMANGIASRKSMREAMPTGLASSVPAWRGYVDGDGWVSVSKRFRPEVGVTGSRELCEQFARFVFSKTDKLFPITPNPPIWKVVTTCLAAVRMAEVLYNAPGPALRRKQFTAHAILAAKWCRSGEYIVAHPRRLRPW